MSAFLEKFFACGAYRHRMRHEYSMKSGILWKKKDLSINFWPDPPPWPPAIVLSQPILDEGPCPCMPNVNVGMWGPHKCGENVGCGVVWGFLKMWDVVWGFRKLSPLMERQSETRKTPSVMIQPNGLHGLFPFPVTDLLFSYGQTANWPWSEPSGLRGQTRELKN